MKSLVLTSAALFLFSSAALIQAQTMTGPEPIASSTETTVVEAGPHSIRTANTNSAEASPEQNRNVEPKVTIESSADSQKHDKTMKRLWMTSLGALAGANALDAISSWGKQEGNPLLRSSDGTFGARGLAIKSGIIGASLVPQYLLRDHKEMRKTFAIINFAESAYFSTIAFHNFSLPAVKVH
jgi:hypothetical protein